MRRGEDNLNAHKVAPLATILDVHIGFTTLLNDFKWPTTPKGQKRIIDN